MSAVFPGPILALHYAPHGHACQNLRDLAGAIEALPDLALATHTKIERPPQSPHISVGGAVIPRVASAASHAV